MLLSLLRTPDHWLVPLNWSPQHVSGPACSEQWLCGSFRVRRGSGGWVAWLANRLFPLALAPATAARRCQGSLPYSSSRHYYSPRLRIHFCPRRLSLSSPPPVLSLPEPSHGLLSSYVQNEDDKRLPPCLSLTNWECKGIYPCARGWASMACPVSREKRRRDAHADD